MCGLCGIFEEGRDWADSYSHRDAFQRTAAHTRGQERQTRTRIANKILAHYGLKVRDWQGGKYILSNRTGRQTIVSNLAHMWDAADDLARGDCDPLADALLEALANEPA